MSEGIKHIALEDIHQALGGKMTPFAGFLMPVQYSGIIDEHLAVRRNVGVFDVSHMGEFIVQGPGAEAFLNRLTTNNVAKLNPGDVQYSAMLYDDGGIVDDLLVYRFNDHFMMVVNASNIDKDFKWAQEHLPEDGSVRLENASDRWTLLAIQGPRAADLVSQIASAAVKDIVYYNFREGEVAGVTAVISRTGYTGEDGFELYAAREDSEKLWQAVWEAGLPLGLKPVGLGARDSLRLEAAYCLYGNDIDHTTNPIEANLGWIVKTKKPGGFIGIAPVLAAKENSRRRLAGFVLTEKGLARHDQPVMREGKVIGRVTSGGWSPILEVGIGLAYIDKPCDQPETSIEIDARGRLLKAQVTAIPFYKRQ